MTRLTTGDGHRTSGPQLLSLTMAALATALVFLFTFLVKIPAVVGYIHLGDAFLMLYAVLSGNPLCLLVGAFGEGLADVAGGYVQYLPATMVIKALLVLPICLAVRQEKKNGPREKLLTKRVVLAALPSIPITLGGYFLADYLLFRAYAYAALWPNAVQSVGSLVVFLVLAAAFEKSGWPRKSF